MIGFFGANKTLNATAIPSLDFGSFSMPITANFLDGALNVFKWFEKHPSVGVKVGRLANQDDTIFTLVFIVIVVAIIALIAIFIRSILLNTIFVGSLIRIFMVVYGRVLLFLWCSLFELFERLL
ncbi:hypothetical protein [Helicobacter pylori]|uniref:hypothetical protein n=1 Tax=Helicobacter pylori TaxID=210 RepID=UPI001E4FC19D|nr:hypothetical protein [Helicobacter pylori]